MKYLFILLLTAFSLCQGYSQNAFDVVNSHNSGDVQTEQASVRNPWWGSKLAYNLDEDRPLSESFLLSARILYIPASGDRWAVPVVGEVGLGESDILNPASGVNLGIYPYYLLSKNSQFELVLHGGVGYKVIEADVDQGESAPTQVKILAGIEAIFNPANGSSPTTLSVTPLYMFNNNAEMGNTGGLEVTGVVPIAKGIGLLAEGLLPFTNGDFNSGVRFGVIINGRL